MGRCLGCIAAQQIIGELQAELVQVREEVERLNVTIRKEMEMRRDAYVKIAALKAERDSITRHAMKMVAKFKTVNADLLAALENLENDDGAIPEHAWSLVTAAIKKAKEKP